MFSDLSINDAACDLVLYARVSTVSVYVIGDFL